VLKIKEFDDVIRHIENGGYNSAIVLLRAMKKDAENDQQQAENMEEKKTFKLHWLGGRTETIKGKSIADAFMLAGYGGGASNALDWYEECI